MSKMPKMPKVENLKNAEDSLAAGHRGGQLDRKRNFGKTNIEYRIRNVECRRKRPFEILRFDILLCCGSLFRPGEVSYKKTEQKGPQPSNNAMLKKPVLQHFITPILQRSFP